MSYRANKSLSAGAHALIKQRHRHPTDGGSESLPTSKRLWQNDDELVALETFALASDRKAAIDALKKDGQSSIQCDIFGVMLALQDNRVEDAEAISNQIAERVARTPDGDIQREWSRWEVVLEEMDLQASLKAWDNDPSKRKDVLSKLSEALGLTFNEHKQDASYRRRAEAAAGDTGSQYPSSISAEAKAEKLTGLVEAWIDDVQCYCQPLAPEVLTAIVSSEAVMKHLSQNKPKVIPTLLDQVSKLGGSCNTTAIPGLVRLIAEGFQFSSEDGKDLYFGHNDIHKALTLDQMHELAAAHPPVLGMATFLVHMAKMLHELTCGASDKPSVAERTSFLTALQDLLESAPDSANWLRAQCLCSLLRLQREKTGWASPATLSELLRLPRRMPPPWTMPNDAQTRRSRGAAPHRHKEQCEAQSPDCDTVQPVSELPGLGSGDFTMEELKTWMTDAVMAPDGGPHHFEKGSGLLAGVLDAETERRIVASAMLLAGKGNIADWTSALKAAGGDPRGVAARTHLRFSPDCRKAFMPGEEVTLKLDAKNCRSLMVKVFEINTWNFCLDNNLKEVDADIELEGLGATHSFSISLADLPATQQKRLEVSIPQLTGRRGSFVVELLGGGLACRSLLRIGRLYAVQDLVASGHSFQLLWEDGTPVEKPKVWVDNTEYNPEGESRSVVVPFSTCGTLRQAALLGCQDGDMAQVMHFEHRAEEYSLEASMFMEKESLVPQAQAPLVVWASVRLNGMAVPISRLDDACLFVSVVDSEGTRSEQKFEVNTASAGKGKAGSLMLELKEVIGMPEDPVLVEARLEGSIRMVGQSNMQTGQQEVQRMVASEAWRALSGSGTAALHGIYLTRANGGHHILSVKGRAGEPVKDAALKVTLYAGSLGPAVRDQQYTCGLQTNEHGEVELGDLQGFSDLLVELRSTPSRNTSSCMQEFQLLPPKPAGESTLPPRLNIQANNETPVRVPYSAAPAVRVSVFGEDLECSAQPSLCQIPGSFACMTQQNALKNVSSVCLSVEPGYLLLSNVPPGRYRLCLSGGSNITVHSISTSKGGVLSRSDESGRKWMMSPESIASASDDHPLQICGLTASATGGLLVQLGGSEAARKEATVSVCFTRFVPPSGDGARADSALLPPWGIAAFNAGAPVEEQRIPPPSGGELVAERHLSEELRYVLERRQMLLEGPACPGSVLQPPSLLVHPQQRSTSESRSRELNSDMARGMMCRSRGLDRLGDDMNDSLLREGCFGAGGDNMAAHVATRCLHSFVPAPLILDGLKPGPDGAVRVSALELLALGADLAPSGHFMAVARAVSPCHGASCAWADVQGACSPASAPVVATCPPRPFEPGSCCVETRRVAVLRAEQVQTLADPGNLRLRVLDSLPKVWDHLGSLLSEPLVGGALSGSRHKDSEAWRKMDFIARWPSLGRAQKLKHLAEQPCHELHFYVAVNDTGLFKEAVQPLLAAKHPLERGFMDDWLLLCPTSIGCLQEEAGREAAQEMVQRWGSPGRIAELNAAERILLAMLSDALEIMVVPALAYELRDLARLYASTTTNESVLEQQRLSSRRRFAAALRAGGDGEGPGGPGGPAPGAPPPPPAMAAAFHPRAKKKKAIGGARSRGPMPEMDLDEEEEEGEFWADELVEEEEDDDDDDSFVDVKGELSSEEGSGEEDGDGGGSTGAPGGGDDDWLEELLTAKRLAPRTKFQRPGPTKKWFESGWAGSSGASSRNSPRVPPNAFWADVALQLAERLEEAVDVAKYNADEIDDKDPQLLLLGRPLVSRHLLEALDVQQAPLGSIDPSSRNNSAPCGFTAALLAVSFMAMPERPGCSVDRDPQTRALTIQATTPGLAFIQEMLVVPPNTHKQEGVTASGLTIIRRLCEEGAKEGEQVEGPLEAGRLYRYEVVISSALPTATVLDVLVAIPKGSLPEDAKPSKGSVPCKVAPYGSKMIQAKFYFPFPVGEAGQYPVTAASPEGELVANSADEAPLQVLARLPPKAAPAKTDKFDWTELSQGGTDEEVLEFLETGNLSEDGVDLEEVAWRARERPAFLSGALAALRRRRVFDRRLWQYALLHSQEDAAVREALSLFPELCHLVGPCFDSQLLSVDPRDCGVFHMELWPLVNPRAHPLPEPALDQALQMAGKQRSKHVFNSDLQQAWGCLLSVIARRPGGPSPAEAVSAAYYLVLQERLAEAREVLESHGGLVGGTPEALAMQRDYMVAWLALRQPGAGPSKDQLQAAWDSCKRHLQPGSATASNPRWCKRWEELAETLVVLRGSGFASGGLQGPTGLVGGPGHPALQPVPLLTVRPMGGWTLEVVAEALEVEEIQVRIFPMDAEALFSTSPFSIADHGAEGAMGSGAGLGKFSIVAPAGTMRIPAPQTSEPQTVDISGILPGMEESGAVMVQLAAGGASCSVPVYSGGLRARGNSREGILYVSQCIGKGGASADAAGWGPAPAAYCKVYFKDSSGSERFYKDGYTDILGRFDYASLSGPPSNASGGGQIYEMAALVVSPQSGCVIVKLGSPAGLR